MNYFRFAIAAVALSLPACSTVSSPVAPSAPAIAAAFDDPIFSRAFLQNGYESPDQLAPIRMLPGPFRVYLRTQDDSGRTIDPLTLDSTERLLNETVPIWSGGTFGIAEIVRGIGTREKTPGWITVKWSTAATPDRCGNSTVGVDGGFIELNVTGSCSCGLSTAVYPRLVRHELGHAMGYYHTDNRADVMFGKSITSDACDLLPSDRERRLAQLAHADSH